jgi:LacI family transcriptional regulator
MRHIAEQVGTSVKSVSRVLNGEPGVSAATAERILAVARELGFRRNDLARDLRRGDRTGTVGLVLKHSSTRFYYDLIRGIEEVADRHGALVITASSRTAERESATLLALSSRRVDGLLIMPTGDDQSYLRPEQSAGMPLVFVDRPPAGLTADTVLADDLAGGRAATEHLLGHGHRRIGVIGASPRLHTVAQRLGGYRAALEARGLDVDDGLLDLDRDGAEAARTAATRLLGLPDPPTALFTLNNLCTIGAARALRDRGASRRVALVGFDDFELADLVDPPVTVVQHDVTGMGRIAAELLFARIDGRDTPPETVVLATALVARGSGEIRPAAVGSSHPR